MQYSHDHMIIAHGETCIQIISSSHDLLTLHFTEDTQLSDWSVVDLSSIDELDKSGSD